jgi:hypothetical protein
MMTLRASGLIAAMALDDPMLDEVFRIRASDPVRNSRRET